MTAIQPADTKGPRIKRESRSRKGCPECRSRKIKCDEQRPECGQCLKAGRVCRMVDSLFKPHSYTFLAQTPPKSKTQAAPAGENVSGRESTGNTPLHQQRLPVAAETEQPNARKAARTPPNKNNCAPSTSTWTSPGLPFQQESNLLSTASAGSRVPTADFEESYQDRCEIAFFFRHFCEGPGKWMDICGSQSYFSRNAVIFAHRNPLIRYAACALAAKQLGQTRQPEAHVRGTNRQRVVMKALIDTKLGFTWYGAKYYEKAIQLLAQQISSKDASTSSMSPNHIYGLSNIRPETNSDDADVALQIIAACILCQYEDVNATIQAWSGHLDGVFRLLRPHLPESACFQLCTTLPQPAESMDAVFWFFVVNDLMNAFVTHRKTRIGPENNALWCRMGLPLDRFGNLVIDGVGGMEQETLLYRALIRIMCQMVNSDIRDAAQWVMVSEKFDGWQKAVPPSFYVPTSWPPDDPELNPNPGSFARETWFASDISAITLAMYHMSRTILLTEQLNEPLVALSPNAHKDIGSYDDLRQEVRKHSVEIIAIMHAIPSERFQKYMLQPLYIAGRCLIDEQEQKELLNLLRTMAEDLGLFTDYRIQDLCEGWGMPYSGIDRRDGLGILT
ncbi:Zn(II)2Cys6 transcription factor [Aspergillus mulundensis]|uniref:Zn(2)-C6 fungal-type domain-containing protein n=1 Tax=Aspergillus mulundensis TaxID=1810919 RepID=A0A3D8R4H9_9EURO|nr:hypothetical protein DSM5745_08647 [Aspergillus mulundensis]RDW68887.1 hypothetical protein DSM5745_08647 [Aspergillus mulundensis]